MARPIRIVELLSQCGFPVADRIYGQHFLKLDLLASLESEIPTPIRWHLVGKAVTNKFLPWDVETHDLDSEVFAPDGYVSVLEALCRTGDPVIAVSSFGMHDSTQLVQVGLLKRKYRNLSLVVILHCPECEYIRRFEPTDVYDSAIDSPAQQNVRTLGWYTLFAADYAWNIVDRYVAVSDEVYRSFQQTNGLFGRPLFDVAKLAVITNGIDTSIYQPACDADLKRLRSQRGIADRFVVGMTSGWKQYKGKDIVRRLLLQFAKDPHDSPDFLLPLLLGYSGESLLQDLASPDLVPLVEAGRIHLFFEAAKWRKLLHYDQIVEHYEIATQNQARSQAHREYEVFIRCWRGVLREPSALFMDLYLRPSLSEAFGRGAVEALLCGTHVLTTDRGFLPQLVDKEWQVSLGPSLDVATGHGPSSSEYDRDVTEAANGFREAINRLRTNGTCRYVSPVDNPFPLRPMVNAYGTLFSSLANSREHKC